MARPAVTATDDSIAGPHGPVPIRRYTPPVGTPSASSAPIVWVHGGGFFAGGLDLLESDAVARALAADGFSVVTIAYRLVPPPGLVASGRRTRASSATASAGVARSAGGARSTAAVRYPIPLDDVVAVVRQVQSEHPGGVILGGASAGACLSAATVLRLAAMGDGQPVRGVFFAYGLFHAVFPAPPAGLVRPTGRRRYTHAPRLLNLMTRNYAGTPEAMSDPFAFPGGHPVGEFPRTLMLDADRDSIRASSDQFARELEAAGVELDYHLLPGTQHAFLNRPSDPAFATGVRLIADWAGAL
ncbi:alpha/beta hydrolase [Plantibacter sp. YIM 135249]|uniref:alpha/beta hydrolase n=1 Tax=Plantibacter sp. YIM 135249 TaxID=3423918 RepID=UPI003D34A7F2